MDAAKNAPLAPGTFEEDWSCDYCHVQLVVVKQMTLNDLPHEVRACTRDPSHTKIVPA